MTKLHLHDNLICFWLLGAIFPPHRTSWTLNFKFSIRQRLWLVPDTWYFFLPLSRHENTADHWQSTAILSFELWNFPNFADLSFILLASTSSETKFASLLWQKASHWETSTEFSWCPQLYLCVSSIMQHCCDDQLGWYICSGKQMTCYKKLSGGKMLLEKPW